MNEEEKSKRNDELRVNAPIPRNEVDIRGLRFENIHNGIIMKIVSSWVGDTGVVIWTSDAGDLYSTREIEVHWKNYRAVK